LALVAIVGTFLALAAVNVQPLITPRRARSAAPS
jgi:hypothetical protein